MVLIVGGAGYIGSHVNKLLSKRGYDTVILDNLVYGHREFVKWGEFIEGDLGDEKLVSKILNDYPITAIMHFAAFAYVGEAVMDPQKYYLNNVSKTIALLKAFIESRFSEKVFIFSSTCAVYGKPKQVPIEEDHDQNPINAYGTTKLMVEKILQDYEKAYNLKYAVLRYFNAAGADPESDIGEDHDPETHLIPLALDAAMGRRESIQVFGTDYNTDDGTCVRDYIHVNDLANAHILSLESVLKDKISRTYNLGNGEGYSVYEVIESVRRISKKSFEVDLAARRKGDPPRLIGSSNKIKKELGWQSEFTNINDIVGTAWEWHKKRFN